MWLLRWKNSQTKLPTKVLPYFPLFTRLLTLYTPSKIGKDMIRHDKYHTKDMIFRRPIDAKAWKEFDEQYPNFASDPRNIRLELTRHGSNLFHVMSSTHSTWIILLIPYNLSLCLCMKQSSIILSIIIPSEKAPGMDIDV